MPRQKKKPVVGLDLDGVVLDHTDNKLLLCEKFGVKISRVETASDIVRTKFDPATYDKFQSILYDAPEYVSAVTLVPGAREGLDFLRIMGVTYFIISRRKTDKTALAALKLHALWPRYFNEQNVFFVQTKAAKDPKAAELNITHYIDDQPSVLAHINSVPNKFLLDPLRAYNKKEGDYITIHSWRQFLNRL